MSRVVATVMLAIPVAIKLLLCSGDYGQGLVTGSASLCQTLFNLCCLSVCDPELKLDK